MMRKFFKREDKPPFSYTAIEERRRQTNHLVWIIGITLLIAIGIIAYLLF